MRCRRDIVAVRVGPQWVHVLDGSLRRERYDRGRSRRYGEPMVSLCTWAGELGRQPRWVSLGVREIDQCRYRDGTLTNGEELR